MTSDALPPAHRRNRLPVFAVGLFLIAFASWAVAADDAVSVGVEAQASYTLGPGDSKPLARTLASFRAKRKAAGQAADRFAEQRMIQFVDRDKNELVCLVAEGVAAELLEDRCFSDGAAVTCAVNLHALVRLSDFIDAQLTSLQLGAQEGVDYRAEMEPEVVTPFRPGQSLAKAYRLIHNQKWRMAIIYLDRITRQYPNWWEPYEVKAVALKHENQISAMQQALQRACALGSTTACADLK